MFSAHPLQLAPVAATGGASAAVTMRKSEAGKSAPRGQGPRVYYSDGRDVWADTPRKPVSLPRAVTVTFDGKRAVSLPKLFDVRRTK